MTVKITKAQREFLERHRSHGSVGRFQAHKTYDFVGRLRDQGLIEIHDGDRSGWPYSWERTTITPAGLAAISPPPQPTDASPPLLSCQTQDRRLER